ncbi:vacuolar protein sorting protein 16, putative [Bodo saltans]|uniref:Vacuolar protein sorting protein 16, putative n=1 Tax=Bodo saltans TaxID=75058 RepID=A0A0S4JRF5_BODSA|nr:vacuolar protein sorting protein 16, putative [Bodo saltans]|eukprot:CUG91904.1 vacuolar protein sorting protein 16, putative [Bodo saltans]
MDTKSKIQGGVQAMRINPTSEHIVILSGTGALTVSPLNFESSRLVINFGLPLVASALQWAGPRFVALSYKCSSVDSYYSDSESPLVTILIPADEDSPSDVKFERLDWDQDGGSGWCSTAQEVDGLRVVTDSSYLLIEDVPQAVVDLCQLKPTSEVGKFAQAYRQMSSGNVSGLTTIRDMVHRLKGNFEQRVIEPLLDAALGEFSAVQQENILAAAADAKSRCSGFDTERYVDVVRRLRALNTLRRKEHGLPLSTRQYAYLSGSESLRSLSPSEMQVILDRLVNRGAYQLAFDISTALKQRSQKILIQWSCALVQDRTVDDVTLAHMIAKVMSQHSGASYIEAARAASGCGRQTLAIHLLQQEQRAQQQVFLLMQMGQEDLALQKACDSDEVDLIILVLCKLIAQRSEQHILNAFSTNPKAQQWLTLGSMYFRPWRKIHRRLLEDANKGYQQGYRELHRILTNDRDGPATSSAGASGGPLGDRFESKSSRGDRAASSSDSNPADEAEADEYDQLEELRDATDDEDDSKPKKSSSGITDLMGDLFGKKDKKKKGEDSTKVGKKAASKSDAEHAPLPAPPTGPILLEDVPFRRRIEGTNIITTDDMIHLCSYFTPNSAAELDGKWCRNHMALLEEQRLLVEETGMEMFMNQSVVQTIELCYRYDMDNVAERLVKKFHVNEKKFTFAKLRALCSACRWTEVDKMFGAGAGIRPKSFKSCIGFGPIISTLHQYDRQQQAAQFVPRLEDVCQRVEWYVKLDSFQAAIDDAFNEESPELIQQVLKKARNPTIVEYGNRKLKELQ